MPLSLRPPRAGKTPNFEIRGTYLGCRVEVSSGTPQRSIALKQLKRIKDCIEEHGQYPAPVVKPDSGEPTFLSAAIAHMRNGGERRYVGALIKHFGQKPLREMDQAAIDDAAITILPAGAPDYRNRAVYAPTITILRNALGDKCPSFKRPKGSKGRQRKEFMWPEDAFAILAEAAKIDAEFELYLLVLLYAGVRKSEGLKVLAADTRPDDLAMWLQTSKNGDPRMLKIRRDLAGRLKQHLAANPGRERLFRFNGGGSHFKHMLLRCTMAVCGIPCPRRRPTPWRKPKFRLAFVTFHTFRHTWATWMRMYGGIDTKGLVGTGNWRDERSAARYSHVVPRDEWDRVDDLPSPGNMRGKTDVA